ncbi:MAG: hypothetical protein AB1797_02870 [bacterium]
MIKKLTICLSLFIFILIIGCAKEEVARPKRERAISIEEATAPAILAREITRPAPSLYMYRPLDRRDPFKALIEPKKEVTAKPTTPKPKPVKEALPVKRELDIEDLTLAGIIWDAKNGGAMALLHNGDNYGFILKEGRLWGKGQRRVEGIYGQVIGEQARLVQDKTKITLKVGESATERNKQKK